MKYDLANNKEAGEALALLLDLTRDGKKVELKEIRPRRTLAQNAYLHLIIGAFGNHFGYAPEEAKLVYKELNASIYKYEKEVRGHTWTFWRSSAELNKEEMAASIDTFMEWSKKAGYPLPLATDQGWLREIENEMERSRYYLRGSNE